MRTEQWRYAEYGQDGVNGAMLFDPQADPLEMKNLADDPKYRSVAWNFPPSRGNTPPASVEFRRQRSVVDRLIIGLPFASFLIETGWGRGILCP